MRYKIRDQILEYIRKRIYTDHKSEGIETKEIAEALHMQRSNVSSILNALVKENILEKSLTRPVLYSFSRQEDDHQNQAFDRLIACNRTLKNAIQSAKAALLHPHKSLSLFIIAKPGCGTSYFVETVYQYAIDNKIFKHDAPFIKINTKYYMNDLSKLDDILFGENSCFEKAKGGLLFIDGFDNLDGHQQSRIISFLDTAGSLTYENQKGNYDDVYMIISSSQNSMDHLISKFPVIIELPELKNWSFKERLELIYHFFTEEAQASLYQIQVSIEAIKGLLLGDYGYNLKELKHHIVMGCANACVRVVSDNVQTIYVQIDDFDSSIKRSLIKVKDYRNVLDDLLGSQAMVIFGSDSNSLSSDDNIYSHIKKQYYDMVNKGMNTHSVEDIINNYIKSFFDTYHYNLQQEDIDYQQLSKIIDHRIISLVSDFINQFEQSTNRKLKSHIFYGLCFHINSLIKENKKTSITNDQIVTVIQMYPNEYISTSQFITLVNKELDLNLNITEAVILVLFLIDDQPTKEHNSPVLLYVMHGSSTAKSLCDVTNG